MQRFKNSFRLIKVLKMERKRTQIYDAAGLIRARKERISEIKNKPSEAVFNQAGLVAAPLVDALCYHLPEEKRRDLAYRLEWDKSRPMNSFDNVLLFASSLLNVSGLVSFINEARYATSIKDFFRGLKMNMPPAYCDGSTGVVALDPRDNLGVVAHELTHSIGKKGSRNHLLTASATGYYFEQLGLMDEKDYSKRKLPSQSDFDYMRARVPSIGALEGWLDFYAKGRRIGAEAVQFEKDAKVEGAGLFYIAEISKGATPESAKNTVLNDEVMKKRILEWQERNGCLVHRIGCVNRSRKDVAFLADSLREDGTCYPKLEKEFRRVEQRALMDNYFLGSLLVV